MKLKMYFDIILLVIVASASTHITTSESITQSTVVCNKVGLCQVMIFLAKKYKNHLRINSINI